MYIFTLPSVSACRGRLIVSRKAYVHNPIPQHSSQQMKTALQPELETTVAARIAGEDIASGDFVAVMNEIIEFPSYMWCCSGASLAPDEPVRVRHIASDAGQPYKVFGVCLPFVYAKSHQGQVVVIDTRTRQLVRLDQTCARTVWDKMKSPSTKTRK